jgi:ATP-binding cassette subfamily F protein 3
LPKPLLAIDDQAVGYGDQIILNHVGLTIAPGDRIALLGRNGAGKSTLTKLLAGELKGIGGKRTEARDLRIGYFAQHQLEQLFPDLTPLDHLKKIGGDKAARSKEQELRDYLAGFGFRGERVFEKIGPFSGGEKARLALALVSYLQPNLLLLDEPTNHLDLEMRQALAVALQDYNGAVILVSHDRHLLRTFADQFLIVANGAAKPFDGDLEDYAAWLSKSDTPTETPKSEREAESAESKKNRKRDEAERRNRLTPLRNAVAKCDRELERLSSEKAKLDAQLADPDLYDAGRKVRLADLLAAQRILAVELERVESAWLVATENLENAEKSAQLDS